MLDRRFSWLIPLFVMLSFVLLMPRPTGGVYARSPAAAAEVIATTAPDAGTTEVATTNRVMANPGATEVVTTSHWLSSQPDSPPAMHNLPPIPYSIFDTHYPPLLNAATNITVAVSPNRDLLTGYVTPNATFTATLKSGATDKGLAVAIVDGRGWFGNVSFYDQGRMVDIASGDTIEAFVNGVKTTFTLPAITGTLDPASNVFSGTISGVPLPASLVLSAHGHSRLVTTDAAGHFSTDWTGTADITQGDSTDVACPLTGGFWAFASFYPQNGFIVYEQDNGVWGYTTPGHTVTVTIRTATGALKASGTTVAQAQWEGGWWYSPGVDIVPGDQVTVQVGGETLSSTVSAIAALVDVAADAVSGIGPANSPLVLWLSRIEGTTRFLVEQSVTTAADGRYYADFSAQGLGRWRGSGYVYHADTPRADTAVFFWAPFALVDQTYDDVTGRAYAGSTVMITVTSASGAFKESQTVTADQLGNYRATFTADIVPGDTVRVTGSGIAATIPITTFTAVTNLTADQVSGQAPASAANLRVRAGEAFYSLNSVYYERAGFASTAQGRYTATLGTDIDLRNGMGGEVHYHVGDDPDKQIQAVTYYAPAMLLAPTYDLVQALAPVPNVPLTLTLRAANGSIKATTVITSWYPRPRGQNRWSRFQVGGQTVDIADDDTVIMSTGSFSDVVTAVSITATVNPDTDVVTGIGPAWTLLELRVQWGGPSLVVPTDGQGRFTADFRGIRDIQTGERVQIFYTTPGFNRVVQEATAPYLRLRVNQSHNWVDACTTPGATVWVTVTEVSGNVKGMASGNARPPNGCISAGEFNWGGPSPDIVVGDRVTGLSSDGSSGTATVVTITGQVDANANTLTGQVLGVPYPATVQGEIWQTGATSPRTQTDMEGRFTLDFSPFDVQPGMDVAAWYIQPDGHWVGAVFQSPHLFLRVFYGHDHIEGNTTPGATVWVTATNSLGQFKGTNSGTAGENGEYYISGVYSGTQQADIVPTDWVTAVSSEGITTAIQVIRIEGVLDLAANTISGTMSGPGATFPGQGVVRVHTWDDHWYFWYDLAIDANGRYFLNMSDQYDVVAGDEVQVFYHHGNQNYTERSFLVPVPDLVVEKYNWGQAAPGGRHIYEIRYRNAGQEASNVLITDTLPAGMTYITHTAGFPASVVGNRVVFSLGSLRSGQDGWFYLIVAVSGNLLPGATLTNRVEIGSSQTERNPGNNTAQATTTLQSNGTDVTVWKNPRTGDPVPGEQLIYEIGYQNQGSTTSGLVRITDTLPISTTFVRWWADEPGWRTVITSGGRVVWEKPALASNQGNWLYLVVQLDNRLGQNQPLTNTVAIATPNDTNPGNNSQSNVVWTSQPRLDLYVYKQHNGGPTVAGGRIHYGISYGNNGNVAVHNVLLTDTLPAGMTWIEAVHWTDQGEAPLPYSYRVGNDYVWNLGTLIPGMRKDGFEIRARIDDTTPVGTILTNVVRLTTSDHDADLTNNTASQVHRVYPSGPNLYVDKRYHWNGPGQLEYTIRLDNRGDQTVNNVWLTDTYPLSTTFANWWVGWSKVPITATFSDPHQALFWIERLDGGDTMGLTLQLNLDESAANRPGLVFTNTAQVTLPPGDTEPADNRSLAVAFTGPDLYVSKRLAGGLPLPGNVITFDLEYGNRGDQWDASGITSLVDTLPAGVSYVSASQIPTLILGNYLIWYVNPPGRSYRETIQVTARLTGSVWPGDRLTNTLMIQGGDPAGTEPDYDNNTATTTFQVAGATLTPTATPSPTVTRVPPRPTITPTPTDTPAGSPTPTLTPVPPVTPLPTITGTPTPTLTPVPTRPPQPTDTPTATPSAETPTPTETQTPMPASFRLYLPLSMRAYAGGW